MINNPKAYLYKCPHCDKDITLRVIYRNALVAGSANDYISLRMIVCPEPECEKLISILDEGSPKINANQHQ